MGLRHRFSNRDHNDVEDPGNLRKRGKGCCKFAAWPIWPQCLIAPVC
jgi:hypothetical protein